MTTTGGDVLPSIFSANALAILRKRYLWRDGDGNPLEEPEELLWRVARAAAEVERQYGANEDEVEVWTEKFFYVMHDLLFLPNSPALMNLGTDQGSASACFVLPLEDSMESIMKLVHDQAMVEKFGGGVGFPLSNVRPRDYPVATTQGFACGPVRVLKVASSVGTMITQGGKRDGAHMAVMSVYHPDIEEFISCKETEGDIHNFNISVGLDSNFMMAVENDHWVHLAWPMDVGSYSEPLPDVPMGPKRNSRCVKARDLFSKIVQGAWGNGEPGAVWLDRMNEDNTTPELGKIEATNPCVTGDTLIAVADGRGSISIKQLADEVVDVPVYCSDLEGWKHIRWGRAPRKTGENFPVYKVTLDDGTYLKTTSNHRFYLKNGTKKEVSELVPGDSLMRFDKYQFSYSQKNLKYWGVQRARKNVYQEHRLISEFNLGRSLDQKEEVHHKDFDGLNNDWSNLIPTFEHKKKFHDISGDKNPMRRFPEKNWRNDSELQRKMRERFHVGKKRSLETCLNIGLAKKKAYAENESYGAVLSERMKELWRNSEYRESQTAKMQRVPIVARLCPQCNEAFEVKRSSTKIFCSLHCAILNINSRRTKGSKVKSLETASNHKVESVEFYGYEDVYNLTVDDFHNYAVITLDEDDRKSGVIVGNCGEEPLLPQEVCTLGSINLKKMVRPDGSFSFALFEEVIQTAVRFLDNVTDNNHYPTEGIARMNSTTRKIGLGVMGWADALVKMGIPYSSVDARRLALSLGKVLRQTADAASEKLGEQKGDFPAFKNSTLTKTHRHMRNAWRLSIAPTGTISTLADCSSGIEPHFALAFKRRNMSSSLEGLEFQYLNEDLREAMERAGASQEDPEKFLLESGLKAIFEVSSEISPRDHILMQAAWQSHVDAGVSKTINLPNSATLQDAYGAYMLAWKEGCKGITVYRAGSREREVLVATSANGTSSTARVVNINIPALEDFMQDRPRKVSGHTERVRTGHGTLYVTVNHDEQGRPFELFSTLGKAGSCEPAVLEAISRLVSMALRSGIDSHEISRQLRGISCCPVWDDGVQIKSIPDAIAKILSEGSSNADRATSNEGSCRECGGAVYMMEGCWKCTECGYSKCG